MGVVKLHPHTPAEYADAVARRLIALLRESRDPEGEMCGVLLRLEEAGLWNGSTDPKAFGHGAQRFFGFAHNVIAENLDLREALSSMSLEFHPQSCETIGDLVSYLLPAAGGLE